MTECSIKKVLFITHDVGIYGASRSLQALIRNYPDVHIDLAIKKRLLRGNDIDLVRKRFGNNVREVMEYHLPFDLCWRGKPDPTAFWYLTQALWSLNKSKLYKMIKERKYDYIHLNSLTLHSVIRNEHPFVLHVREIHDGKVSRIASSLRNAAGVIYIDSETERPFRHLGLSNGMVLNNPFHMCRVMVDNGRLAGVDCYRKTIFCMVGRVNPDKGVDFVINSFRASLARNAVLLLVGIGSGQYVRKCRELADDDARIVFYGEEHNIEKIYSVCDYVIRGEPYFCIGRTVYEGLYSGCGVIIPGDKSNAADVFEYDRFREKIHFYAPGSEAALKGVFDVLGQKKIESKRFESNIDSYMASYANFVERVLGDWKRGDARGRV